MMSDTDVFEICRAFYARDMQFWVTGGWGIDALLKCVTRDHKDLDLLIHRDDTPAVWRALQDPGYCFCEYWSENQMVRDRMGNEVPTAFDMVRPEDCHCDAHAITFDVHGQGIPAWNDHEDLRFTPNDLAGRA